MTCCLPSRAAAKAVTLYSPDGDAPFAAAVANGPEGAAFTVSGVKAYCVAAVAWKRRGPKP